MWKTCFICFLQRFYFIMVAHSPAAVHTCAGWGLGCTGLKTSAVGPLCPRPEEKHFIFSCCNDQIQPCDTRSRRSPMSVSLLVLLQFRFCLLVTGPSLCFGLCRGIFTRRWDLSDSLPTPHPSPRPQDNMAGVFSPPPPTSLALSSCSIPRNGRWP